MKIAILSDLHVFPWPEFSTLTKKGPSRLLDCVSVLRDVRAYCLEHDVEVVAFCGDLMHRRGVVSTLALNLVVRELELFKKREIEVLAVDGNHDQADRQGLVHHVEALHRSGLVHGVMPAGKGWAVWSVGGLEIVAVPYCDGRDELARRLDRGVEVAGRGEKIALLHHGFQGAKVGTHLEYEVREPISASDLLGDRRFSFVFSGHYHAHQSIVGIQNAFYVGSPLEHVRGTVDAKKGFLVYDVEERSFAMVPLDRPRFVTLGWDDLARGDLRAVEGNFVDATWKDYPGGEAALASALREAGAAGVRLVRLRGVSERSKLRAPLDPRTPPVKALRRFLKKRGEEMEVLGVDFEDALRIGKEILSEASEEER